MEKARRLATTGKRVLLLCFNEPLARDLRQKADGFEVETFHDFCRRLAGSAGLSGFEAQDPQVNDQRVYAEEAPMMLLEALARLPDERYDAIVVDEAQDFLTDWWPCLDEALRSGREGTLYAFYDANQDIYDGGPPGALEVIEHKLIHNCRNTTRIAEYAAGLVGTEPGVKAGAPQGRPVERITCASDAEVVRKVAARLDQLVLREGIAPDEIAIVFHPHAEELPLRARSSSRPLRVGEPRRPRPAIECSVAGGVEWCSRRSIDSRVSNAM